MQRGLGERGTKVRALAVRAQRAVAQGARRLAGHARADDVEEARECAAVRDAVRRDDTHAAPRTVGRR